MLGSGTCNVLTCTAATDDASHELPLRNDGTYGNYVNYNSPFIQGEGRKYETCIIRKALGTTGETADIIELPNLRGS